jgi:hypothetical protein
MDFFYDGQVRRYITQFMRIFIGFKTEAGDGTQATVPVMYGDLTRQVANIIKENSENKMPTVPRMACYVTGLELDTKRLSDPSFVSKMNVRERNYSFDSNGDPQYTQAQGGSYTIERLMPTPFTLSMRCDIWTSNTDQKLQLLEQILVLFNPSLEIQTTDNYIDWTSLTAVYLNNLTFTSRSIPQGVDSDIDVCSVDFTMPIYITPPAKVKKLGVVQNIVANVFTEQGDVKDINTLVYNTAEANAETRTPAIDYSVLMLKSNNGQPFDYTLTLIDYDEVILNLQRLGAEFKIGDTIDWNSVLQVSGQYKAGSNKIFFTQPTGFEVVGTFTVNELDPSKLIVSLDQDTVPTNTVLSGVENRGTIDAIVDPTKFDPKTQFETLDSIPLGTRYLLLDNIVDRPLGWVNKNGETTTMGLNYIVEWDGTAWQVVFSPVSGQDPTYIQNLRTGIQYKWDGTQWLKSFEGEYAPGFWRIELDSV